MDDGRGALIAAAMPRVVIGERTKLGFFTTQWEAPKLTIAFPAECPHCGGPVARKRVFSTERATAMKGTRATLSRVEYAVPVCKRVLPSLLTRLLVVFAAFWTVVFGFMALFSVREPTPAPFVLLALASAGLVLAIRAHTWIRVVTFDPGSVTFAVRRADYARKLTGLNRA